MIHGRLVLAFYIVYCGTVISPGASVIFRIIKEKKSRYRSVTDFGRIFSFPFRVVTDCPVSQFLPLFRMSAFLFICLMRMLRSGVITGTLRCTFSIIIRFVSGVPGSAVCQKNSLFFQCVLFRDRVSLLLISVFLPVAGIDLCDLDRSVFMIDFIGFRQPVFFKCPVIRSDSLQPV